MGSTPCSKCSFRRQPLTSTRPPAEPGKCDLAEALLPAHIPPFRETRELMLRKHRLFLEQGNAARPAVQQINTRLEEIKTEITLDFPLNDAEVAALLDNLRSRVLEVCAIEQQAVQMLQAAMS